MSTWRITSKLSDLDSAEVATLKNRALEYLDANQLDHIGCAEELGLEFGQYLELKQRYCKEFKQLYELVVLRCEHVITQAALGTLPEKKSASTQITTAKYILDRRSKDWRNTTKVEHKSNEPQRPNGRGRALVDGYFGSEDGSGNKISSKTVQ